MKTFADEQIKADEAERDRTQALKVALADAVARNAYHQIERIAAEVDVLTRDAGFEVPANAMAQLSIAISLKRIADEMERRVITAEPQSDVA